MAAPQRWSAGSRPVGGPRDDHPGGEVVRLLAHDRLGHAQRRGLVAQQQVLAPGSAPLGARVERLRARSRPSRGPTPRRSCPGGRSTRSAASAPTRGCGHQPEPRDQHDRDHGQQHAGDSGRDAGRVDAALHPRQVLRDAAGDPAPPGARAVTLPTDAPWSLLACHGRAARRARRCWRSSPAATSTARARSPPRSPGRSCCCWPCPARCRSRPAAPGRLAVAGLAGLAAWSAVSLAWAPLAGPVIDGVQRMLLYLGVLLAAVALLRDPRAARAVGAGAGAGRGGGDRATACRAGCCRASRSISSGSFGAGGAARAADHLLERRGPARRDGAAALRAARRGPDRVPLPLRAAALAACAPLGAGVYLSYSRGAHRGDGARPAGAARRWCRPGSSCGPPWPAWWRARSRPRARPRSRASPRWRGARRPGSTDGALMLALLLAIMAIAALVAWRSVAAESRGGARGGRLPFARRLPPSRARPRCWLRGRAGAGRPARGRRTRTAGERVRVQAVAAGLGQLPALRVLAGGLRGVRRSTPSTAWASAASGSSGARSAAWRREPPRFTRCRSRRRWSSAFPACCCWGSSSAPWVRAARRAVRLGIPLAAGASASA